MASWVDDSDDENGDSLPGFQTATKTVPLSAAMMVETAAVTPEATTDSKVAVLMDSDSEEEEEEEEEDVNNAAVEVSSPNASKAADVPSPSPPKQLTKSEKKALKAAEMDDLDALLNEFGVDAADAPKVATTEAEAAPAPVPQAADGAGGDKKKKKKKQQKKKKKKEEEEDNDEGGVVDIKKVLAAKQKAKASTPEGIAAAKAAAEEKKKLEKKKKDKKDKNAMGGGRKKKDVVAHVGHSSNF